MTKRLGILLLAAVLPLSAQSPRINPKTQINWPLITGNGAPLIVCNSQVVGMPYYDNLNNVYYICSTSGWKEVQGGGGGGGVTPNPPAFSVQAANGTLNGLTSDPAVTINTTNHTLDLNGGIPSGSSFFTLTNLAPVPTNWTLDVTTPSTALHSLLTLTTTGTSGAATLSGNVLNIPQYSGGGSSPFQTLTTTGTSGAATLVGGTLNVPQYQQALSLTTTGSTGAATLSGGILNIPQYAGAVSSLSTTGTSGAATLTSGVLNIPNYQGQLTLSTTGTSGPATLSGNTLNIPQYNFNGVTSINSTTGALTFTGSGVSQSGSTFTFSNTATPPSGPAFSVQLANSTSTSFTSDPNITVNTSTHALELNGGIGSGPFFTLTNVSPVTSSWTLDVTSPTTARTSILSLTTSGTTGAATLTGTTLNVPQYAAGAVSSLTTTGTTGAATLTSGVLNIPQYQGHLTLTTTGSGASTLSGNTLNIPTPAAATFTSLATLGTSGAATLTSGVLNIPQYQAALTLTTTGTSGAATLSGGTLNIPQYSGGGVTSINSTTGAMTFTGAGVSQSGNTFTFSGGGGGSGAVVCTPDAQTGTTYTVALTDVSSSGSPCITAAITMANASNNTVTIPPNSSVALPVGQVICVYQIGTGQTAFAAGSGVAIETPTSLSARAQYSAICVHQLVANTWVAFGDLQ